MSNSVAILGGGENQQVSLLEILDHVVNNGVVIQGSIVISLAGVDLIYVGLNVVLTAVETALQYIDHDQLAPPVAGKSKKTKPA
jgi:hypothetical protein